MHAKGEPLLKWSSSRSHSSPVRNNLIVWSANNNDSALTSKASSKVNLLNDDNYRWVCANVIVLSFGQIEQGAHYVMKSLIYSLDTFQVGAVVELVY